MTEIDVATIVVAVSTATLSIITFVYMWETRRIRIGSELPSFSLEPSTYILGGGFLGMDLVNTGQTATDIRLDCSWEDMSKKLYVVSLGTRGHAPLHDIPIPAILQNGAKLSVNISCKDVRGHPYKAPKMEMDFGVVKSENRQVTYQYNPLESTSHSLKEIVTELRNIRSYLNTSGSKFLR